MSYDQDGLSELSPEEMEAREKADSSNEDLKAYVMAAQERQALLDEIKDLRMQATRTKMAAAIAQRESLIYEDRIGIGRNDTAHPSEGMDIVVGHTIEALIANTRAMFNSESFRQGPIALVPVRLWPIAVQPTPDGKTSYGIVGKPFLSIENRKTGEPIPNYELGRTSIGASYAVTQAIVEGTVRQVTISGFARVSINPFGGLDPNSLHTRLDARASHDRWSANSAPDTTVHVDKSGVPRQSDEGAPFIPSMEADRPGVRAAVGAHGTERGRSERTIDGPNEQVNEPSPPASESAPFDD